MNWEPIRDRLTNILNTNVTLKTIPHSDVRSKEADETFFILSADELEYVVFSISGKTLSESEQSLIQWLIEQHKQSVPFESDENETSWFRLRSWIEQQLEENNTSAILPEAMFPSDRLQEQWLPILLQTRKTDQQVEDEFDELKNLLDSFFAAEMILIPMESNQWLMLVSVSLLFDSEEERFESHTDGRQEEALESFGYGLYEMLTSEWFGDCQLAVGRPMSPQKEMIKTVRVLQESLHLGQKYRPEEELYFPWRMLLEWLLDQIDDQYIFTFLKQTLYLFDDHLLDGEMLQTLEQFFEENCNVSETAKKLYIHRNTLVYRLDKFKQETGMDVRNFRHAVLVQIAILLYKVTKH